MFDPYHKWLGIPKDQRPPTYYQLLGIAPGEADAEVIEEAAIRQTSHLRAYQLGPHAELCTRLLNEIAKARATLLDPGKRRQYEQATVQRPAASVTATVPQPIGTPFDDLDDSDDRAVAKPRRAVVRKPAGGGAGLWIALGVAGAVGILGSIVVVVVMLLPGRGVVQQQPRPPVPPVVPVDDEREEPAPPAVVGGAREQVLASAAGHWRLGLEQFAQKHPKYPLIEAGAIQQNVAAEGPGARPGAKVARLDAAYFDAGRDLSPAGNELTVYLRLRDPQGRWDYGLLSKRGQGNQSAFQLTCGRTATGALLVFDVDAANGRSQAVFPMEGIDLRAWHDIVGRYDGRRLQIICDGKIVAERPAVGGGIRQNEQELVIGAELVNGQPRRPFSGEMEDAALWTRSLTDEEVAALSGVGQLVAAIAPAPPPRPPINVAPIAEVKAGEEYRLAMPSVLALTPDGRHALFQTPRGIAVWSVAESRELRTVPAVNIPISRIAVSPDNRTFAAVNFSGKVLVCDLESGALLREIAHGSVVHHAAFSSDGALVVTGGGGSKKDSSIKVWNSKTGELVQTLVDHQYPLATVALHDGIVAGVDMVRTVRRWELKSGMEIDSQKVNARTPFLRFASDNRWAAFVRANRLIIWDLVAKKELRGAPLPAGLSAGQAFDVTPDGRIGIVATSDNKLVFCDLVQGTAATVLSGPQKTIRSVGLTPDGRRALSTDGNRMLHIWKLDEAASQVPAAPLPTAPALKPEAKPQTKTAEWMREQKT